MRALLKLSARVVKSSIYYCEYYIYLYIYLLYLFIILYLLYLFIIYLYIHIFIQLISCDGVSVFTTFFME